MTIIMSVSFVSSLLSSSSSFSIGCTVYHFIFDFYESRYHPEARVGINEVMNGKSGERPLDLAITGQDDEKDVVMFLLSMCGLESGHDL